MTNNRIIKPAGARKSIYHPNTTDVKVMDAILSFTPDESNEEDQFKSLDMSWISEATGIEKANVQKSIKWLNVINYIKTLGRGRGTHYQPVVENNDLVALDPNNLGPEYRPAGGPTVKQIVRTIFNSVEPNQRLAPADVTEISQGMFPEQKLTRQSFGQVFTKMAAAGELFPFGKGRSCEYFRGTEKLEGAAEPTHNYDFEAFFSRKNEENADNTVETTGNTETETTENSEEFAA